jgi:hypothetical protein
MVLMSYGGRGEIRIHFLMVRHNSAIAVKCQYIKYLYLLYRLIFVCKRSAECIKYQAFGQSLVKGLEQVIIMNSSPHWLPERVMLSKTF